VFERKSVVPERTLLAESLKRAVGRCSAEAVEQAQQTYDVAVATYASTSSQVKALSLIPGRSRSGHRSPAPSSSAASREAR